MIYCNNPHGDKWWSPDEKKPHKYIFHFNMAHITSSVYSDVIQAGSMGGKYCGSILLKCLCACITHSAVRLSYENIMAIKWDCGIIPLHCLSPRGCAAVWELPSWTQTRQKWSLISDNILAERIRNQHQSLLPHQIFTSLWRLLLYLQAFLLTNKQSL